MPTVSISLNYAALQEYMTWPKGMRSKRVSSAIVAWAKEQENRENERMRLLKEVKTNE